MNPRAAKRAERIETDIAYSNEKVVAEWMHKLASPMHGISALHDLGNVAALYVKKDKTELRLKLMRLLQLALRNGDAMSVIVAAALDIGISRVIAATAAVDAQKEPKQAQN